MSSLAALCVSSVPRLVHRSKASLNLSLLLLAAGTETGIGRDESDLGIRETQGETSPGTGTV